MADTPLSSDPNPLKRPRDDAEVDHETSGQPRSSAEIAASPDLSVSSLKSPPASPAFTSRTSPPASPAAPTPPASTMPNARPAKRQKLSPQEKAARDEQKKKDKEAKDQLRAQKAEETRKKAEQREAKKREKGVEKQQKEQAAQEKKRQKELEQEKNERSQSRLTKFLVGVKTEPTPLHFNKSSVAAKSPTKHNVITRDGARSRSMSIDMTDSVLGTPQCVSKPDACAEYERRFLPFNLPSSTTMPPSWFSSDGKTSFDSARLDSIVSSPPEYPPTLEEHTSQYKRQRGKRIEPVRDLIAKMEAYDTGSTELNIGDLSNSHIDAVSSALTALSVLRSIPVKYLHFEEEVRPPYCGTWTKCISDRQMHSVARNSTARTIEDINYDYDSEAEWAEPGEGEDVDSDGEEDGESEDGEDDMDGFLDDENDNCVRRNIGLVNSEVQCSGLQWENSSGHSVLAGDLEQRVDLAVNRAGFIIDPPASTSKPYGSTYWGTEASESTKNGPSRLPLAPKQDNFGNTLNVPNSTRRVGKPVDEVSKLLIPLKDLEKFKKAIVGRQETKQDLTKELQKMFPKYTKEVIGTTLSTFASRSTVLRKWFLMDIPHELILGLFDKTTPGSKTQQTLLPSANV